MTGAEVGSVARLWRFPVKSMGGEPLEKVELGRSGLVGDRAYALIETGSGKVVSAKNVKSFPGLLQCRAAFVEPPVPGRDLPPVRIRLSDGATVTSGTREADRALSAHFGRDVTLARSAPDDFTIDQYHPDIEGADPAGHRDTTVESKLGAASFSAAGVASPVAAGAFFDLFPLSVVTTGTLERLQELHPQSRFDPRRFRMNAIVETRQAGFPENAWVGRELAIGDTARIKVAKPDTRCVMTTLAQDDMPDDPDILRALTQHNMLEVRPGKRFPCAGVYAVVMTPGTLRAGDRVTLV
jgi:uncharacterized protein